MHPLKADVQPEKTDCGKTALNFITKKSHKTAVTKRSGMQKLHCRPDGYVCRGQQGEIERMHLPPGKRISVEILVGVGRTVASKSSIGGLYVGARGA